MPRIKYVGVKADGETAFAGDCGIERWMPGSQADVSDAIAERMLKHPDVFALHDGSPSAPRAAKPAPEPAPAPTVAADTPVPSGPTLGTATITLAPGGTVAASTEEPQDEGDTKAAALKGDAPAAPAKKPAAKKTAKKAKK